MPACLSDEQLRQAITGPRGDANPTFDLHLENCPDCLARLKALVAGPASETSIQPGQDHTGPYLTDGTPADPTFPVIPGYTLLRVQGQGGMAVVYQAREHELHRIVALKVIRPGLSLDCGVPRLLHEAHLLGLLSHPAVAQIYRVGTFDTADGPRPFFSMEFVEGETLSEYVRHRRLEMKQLVGLLVEVCEGVHHAHQKGIIHRDLKPSNIMVTTEGRPKVLDFGVARVADPERAFGATEPHPEPVHTQAGALVGTISYMSPEQVGPDRDRQVDTRSDVYALGLIAYKALSGHFPYDLKNKALDEIVAVIRTADPKPLRQVNPGVPTDLQTVIAKALEKDQERRYPSAQSLADDLRRWMADEPVIARPLGQLERAGRFVRRNFAVVGALAGGVVAVIASLLVGLLTTLSWAREAWHQESLANQRGEAARLAEADAVQKRGVAEAALLEARKSKEVAERESRENLERYIQQIVGRGDEAVRGNDLLAALPSYVLALRRDRTGGPEEERHRRRIAALLHQSPRLTHFWTHRDSVTHVEFSPDGRLVVSVSLDGTARLSVAATGQPVGGPLRHKGPINHAAFSHDGNRVVTGGDDGLAQVWDAATGNARGGPLDIKSPVSHVAFHPADAGRLLVVGGRRFARTMQENLPGVMLTQPGPVTMVPGPPIMIPGPGGRMIPGPPRMIPMPGAPIMRPGPSIPVPHRPEGIAQVHDLAAGKVVAVMNTAGWLNHASFSPDGNRVVTAGGSEEGENEAEVHQLVGPPVKRPDRGAEAPLPHNSPVNRASFSPNGRLIVTASGDFDANAGEARLWDAVSRKPVGRPMRHLGLVSHASFGPEGRHVVTASLDGTARVWDGLTGEPTTLPLLHDQVLVACFSPDGRRVLTAGGDGAARIWDAGTGELLLPPLRHGVGLTGAAFDPDGRRVVTAGRDGSVRLWELAPSGMEGPVLRHHGVVPVNPGGVTHTFQRGKPDDNPIVWNRTFLGGLVVTAARSAPGDRVLTTAAARIVETIPGGGRAEIHPGHAPTHVVLWDFRAGRPTARVFPHQGPGPDGLLRPDGRRLVTLRGDDGQGPTELRLWDLTTDAPPRRTKPTGVVHAVTLRPDGLCLVAAAGRAKKPGTGWEVHITDVAGEKAGWEDIRLPLPGPIEAAAFGADGDTLVTAAVAAPGRWRMQRWDPVTGAERGGPSDAGPVNRIAIAPRGTHVAGYIVGLSRVTREGGIPVKEEARTVVHVWEPRSGRSRTLKHPAPVTAVAFSDDGRRIATACLDHTARVWDIANGEPVTPPLKHRGRIHHVGFAPSRPDMMLSASDDRTARLWDVPSGAPLTPPLRHRDAVLSASLSADGRRLMTTCADGTARFWDLTPDEKSVRDLEAIASLLTGARLDERHGETTLTTAELGRLALLPGLNAGGTLGWHHDQAAEAERGDDWYAATFHLDRLIAAEPGPKAGLYSRRARVHARQERWEAAEADYSRVVDSRPMSAIPYYALALLQASRGRAEPYRRTCAALLAAHGKTTDPATASWVVKTCVLLPDAGVDVAELVRLADTIARRPALSERGAALYRAGRFDECAKLLQRSTGYDALFLAMARHRLGQKAEAINAYQAAEKRLAGPDAPWPDRLEHQLIRREAEAALK